MWAGWLDAKPVELPREQAANPATRRRFAEQWSGSNPRFRGAHAVASYLEHEGVALVPYDHVVEAVPGESSR